jgi:nucleoside-diphosphate-sugar epimerase
VTGRTVAVTGGSGFLGRHTVAALAAAGWKVRVLLRSEPIHPLWKDFVPEVVLGSLADRGALERLVDGADAVLHLAGLIKARDDAEFLRVNRDGTGALCEAMLARAPAAHLVLVSSLAARSPELSGYAASKRAGEDAALKLLGPARLSIVRPPAIYGPGDRETLVFFQLASGKLIPLVGRPRARFALIHVVDAARALVVRLAGVPTGAIHAIADDRPAGYAWREILDAAASAVGNTRPRYIPLPPALLRGAGAIGGGVAKLLGRVAMANAGKVRELLHEDWALSGAECLREPGSEPSFTLTGGFADAARWYRVEGWL